MPILPIIFVSSLAYFGYSEYCKWKAKEVKKEPVGDPVNPADFGK